MTAPDRLDYLYREYARIAGDTGDLVRGSFEDIKFFGTLVGLFAWPSIAKSDLFSDASSDSILLIGLLGILFVVGILAMRDLLKQSIIRFYIEQLSLFENGIRGELQSHNAPYFQLADSWGRWEQNRYRPLVKRFAVLVFGVLLAFPDLVLALEAELWHVAIYSAAFCVVVLILRTADIKMSREGQGVGSAQSRGGRQVRP
jgi:hypothetical protein